MGMPDSSGTSPARCTQPITLPTMADNRARRNRLLAGGLVLTALAASLIVVVLIAGVLDRLGTTRYKVRFPVATGIPGLQVGSAVSVGGRKVGTVTNLDWHLEDQTIQAIDVTIAVASDIKLFADATPYLIVPILGGGGSIDFSDLGDNTPLNPGDTLAGRVSPPSFLASAGWGDQQAEQVRAILASAQSIFGNAQTSMDTINDAVIPSITEMVELARQNWPQWIQRIDSTTASVETAAAGTPQLVDDLRARTAEMRSLIDDSRALINDNRPNIDATIANARDATASAKQVGIDAEALILRVDQEIYTEAAGLLTDARATLADSREIVTRAQSLFDEQRPGIRRSMTNFRLASDQLRDTLLEVRRSPWRLLYRPDTRELEYELLYDSARSYAGAVSDLRAASEALEALTAREDAPAGAFDELLTVIDVALSRYQDAEAALVEQLIDNAPRK